MVSRFLGLSLLGALAGACSSPAGQGPLAVDAPPAALTVTGPISPLIAPHLDPARVALGKRLFLDPRLSRDGTVACATCHDLRRSGADRRPVSSGVGGSVGLLNAPTVYNSGLNIKQFWDGRADTLEAQIDGPLIGAEMASTWADVTTKLAHDAEYARAFGRIYRDGVEPANVRDALATFERSLVTLDSRFDRFLRGQLDAITAEERRGYELFRSYGCASCHQGANVGGNMFQTLGVMGDFFGDRGHASEADYGRYNVTKREEHRFQFRVPSLRLAVLTAPYFHDGSVATLEEAIDIMAKYQLGRTIPTEHRRLIIAFLSTLPGELTP